MPCFITGSAAGYAALTAREARTIAMDMTRKLCSVMKAIEKQEKDRRNDILYPIKEYLPADLLEWWERRKSIDAARREDEKRRAAANKARAQLAKAEAELEELA